VGVDVSTSLLCRLSGLVWVCAGCAAIQQTAIGSERIGRLLYGRNAEAAREEAKESCIANCAYVESNCSLRAVLELGRYRLCPVLDVTMLRP